MITKLIILNKFLLYNQSYKLIGYSRFLNNLKIRFLKLNIEIEYFANYQILLYNKEKRTT